MRARNPVSLWGFGAAEVTLWNRIVCCPEPWLLGAGRIDWGPLSGAACGRKWKRRGRECEEASFPRNAKREADLADLARQFCVGENRNGGNMVGFLNAFFCNQF